MAANVEVSRHFVHIECALDYTSILVAEGLFDHLVLLVFIFFPQ